MKPIHKDLLRRLPLTLLVITFAVTTQLWAASDSELNFEKAKSEILSKFIDPSITEDTLYQYALQGMLAGLNQKHPEWNRLYTPKEYQQLQQDLAGQAACIGAEIRMASRGDSVVIISVLPNSPAEKAGIKAQDRILKIDGKSVKGMTLTDVVALLRGNVGESVNLSVLRQESVFDVTVVREMITYDSVKASVTRNGTTVIAIQEFNDNTPAQLQAALEQSALSHPSGVVIDLRQNPGGSLKAMLDSLSLLVPDKTPVAVAVDRKGEQEKITTAGNPQFPSVPLAVLVDGATACGAEMMAETLKTSLGATLVGSQTEGKWNAQTIEEFPNHFAMKYTLKTLTGPKGEKFDGVGITPDVLVPKTQSESDERNGKDATLLKAIEILR